MGELAEARRSLPRYVQEARRRDNRYALANLRCRNNIIWLGADDPARAASDLEDAHASFPRPNNTYRFQDYFALVARVDIALYTGRPEEAARLLAEDERQLKAAHLARVVSVDLNLRLLRVRTALALAAGGDRAAAAVVAREVRALARMQPPVARPLSRLFGGLLADLRGDGATAAQELRAASIALDELHCALYAAAASWRLGEVLGEPDLVAQANDRLTAREVRSPERMVRLLAPSRG
jgi:hypothetical protein